MDTSENCSYLGEEYKYGSATAYRGVKTYAQSENGNLNPLLFHQ